MGHLQLPLLGLGVVHELNPIYAMTRYPRTNTIIPSRVIVGIGFALASLPGTPTCTLAVPLLILPFLDKQLVNESSSSGSECPVMVSGS